MRILRLGAPRCDGGEGPLWDVAEQALYYIDNSGRKAHRFVPETQQSRSWDFSDVITALALRRNGGAVVALKSGIHLLDFAGGSVERLPPSGDATIRNFNGGKVDRRGRFLIGGSTSTIHDPTPDGGLFRLDPDHRVTRLDHDIHFSNGPCWAPDDRTFYFSDSWRKTIYAYDYNIDTGVPANRRTFVNTAELGGLPDGATVDSDGLLWVAIYGAGKLAAYGPDGQLERLIEMPVKYVSSVMFGGPNLDQLFVTTIARAHGSSEPPQEGAGYVYVVEDLGATGVPEPRYGG